MGKGLEGAQEEGTGFAQLEEAEGTHSPGAAAPVSAPRDRDGTRRSGWSCARAGSAWILGGKTTT